MNGPEDDRRARRAESGEHPPEPARAEQRRQPGRHDHDRPARKGRDDPHLGGADPQQAGDPGEQRDERRLVHIAEREMPPGHDEVQLVLLEAIPAAEGQFGGGERGADQPCQAGHVVMGRCRGRWEGGRESGRGHLRTDPSGATPSVRSVVMQSQARQRSGLAVVAATTASRSPGLRPPGCQLPVSASIWRYASPVPSAQVRTHVRGVCMAKLHVTAGDGHAHRHVVKFGKAQVGGPLEAQTWAGRTRRRCSR